MEKDNIGEKEYTAYILNEIEYHDEEEVDALIEQIDKIYIYFLNDITKRELMFLKDRLISRDRDYIVGMIEDNPCILILLSLVLYSD